jgi:hypothetical protein
LSQGFAGAGSPRGAVYLHHRVERFSNANPACGDTTPSGSACRGALRRASRLRIARGRLGGAPCVSVRAWLDVGAAQDLGRRPQTLVARLAPSVSASAASRCTSKPLPCGRWRSMKARTIETGHFLQARDVKCCKYPSPWTHNLQLTWRPGRDRASIHSIANRAGQPVWGRMRSVSFRRRTRACDPKLNFGSPNCSAQSGLSFSTGGIEGIAQPAGATVRRPRREEGGQKFDLMPTSCAHCPRIPSQEETLPHVRTPLAALAALFHILWKATKVLGD